MIEDDNNSVSGPSQGASERSDLATGEGADTRRKMNGRGNSKAGRMSARRKQDAILRLLRGEGLDAVSRDLNVTAKRLSEWRDAFLAGGEAAIKSRPADGRDKEIKRLRAKVGELTMTRELLDEKIGRLESTLPLARPRSRK